MSDSITLQDIYNLFDRSQAEFQAELAASRAEFDRRSAEADRRAAEADRRAVEADRRAAEADRRLAEFEKLVAQSKAESDRLIREAKAESDRAIKEIRKNINSLTSRWGQFVENFVAPGVLGIFQERGIAVNQVYQRARSGKGQANLEVDILAVDDNVAVIVEVKSRLTQSNIRQVLNTLSQFKSAFPQYRHYQLYGAVAAIEIDGDVDTYAENQGLFVIVQAGETIKIQNAIDFVPRTW